jgi:cytochrome c-type biogenesis protein CcmH/NrfG
MSDAAALGDEIELLVASIDDARAEHAAGDLDDASLARIEARDGARLDDARRRLASMRSEPATPRDVEAGSRRRRARLLAVAAVAAVVAVAVAVLAATDPFATPAPPPRVTEAVKVLGLLDLGESAVAHGEQLRALTAYDAVLRLEPSDAEALIESGWLRYEQGLALHRPGWVHDGAATLRRAVAVAPDEAAAHLYDGIVLYQLDHDRAGAVVQLQRAGDLPESEFEQSVTAEFLAILSRHG